MTNRFVCIHGHFYQPPRENPWTGTIDRQISAYPWHDWNERIAHQCYEPNSKARILDSNGNVIEYKNNYERMSFNFGPTLLNWMEDKRPQLYRSILEADERGTVFFSGHGPAIAQVYGHQIMPLATDRDRRTQIIWGIEDFRRRFNRYPEGMWLPETAVNVETLEVLAGEGILFTILAPHQMRMVHTDDEVRGGYAYRCDLPSGSQIALFSYDGSLAQSIAFGDALKDGRELARHVIRESEENGLEHVAVDGETFGYHHVYGDMALAACLDEIEKNSKVKLTVYGEYLELMPPVMQAEIVPNSSWSCSHGVERWRSDCGCTDGGHSGWNQRWRGPLRDSLEKLQFSLDSLFEEKGKELLKSPWDTRDRAIVFQHIFSEKDISLSLEEEAGHPLSEMEKNTALDLLEMERCAMLMFTSCAWFFDDISRIETIQVLKYAAKAIELGEKLGLKKEVRKAFLKGMERAKSNEIDFADGRDVFQKKVVDTKAF